MMIRMPSHFSASGKSPKTSQAKIVAETISKYCSGASVEAGAAR